MWLLLSTATGALLSAAYWVLLFQVVYSLSAGDAAPGVVSDRSGPPPMLVAIAGFIVYVALAWGWRTLEIRWIVRPGLRP